MAGRHDLGDIRPIAEAAGQGHLQTLVVRGLFVIMVGTDDLGAPLAAEVLEVLAHLGRGLDLEVGETGARFDGEETPQPVEE